jgi:hypothetical protein
MSNCRGLLTNDELERIWKEAVSVYLGAWQQEWEIPENSVEVAGVLDKTGTRHLPKTTPDRYLYTNQLN